MRKSMLIILISIMLMPVFGAAGDVVSSDTMLLRGFKIKESGVLEFVIVDALNDSLETMVPTTGGVSAGDIVITEHLDSFLGNPETSSLDAIKNLPNMPERIVFSFRLSGRDPGRYDISFKMNPFNRIPDETSLASDAVTTIDAAYALGNLNFVFTDSTVGGSNAGYYDVRTDSPQINDSDKNSAVTFINGSASPDTLKQPLHVVSDGSSSWIFRGAVFMMVSESDFDDAALGNYSATVTATLTVPD